MSGCFNNVGIPDRLPERHRERGKVLKRHRAVGIPTQPWMKILNLSTQRTAVEKPEFNQSDKFFLHAT